MLITNRGEPLSADLGRELQHTSDVLIAAGYVSPAGCEILDLQELAGRVPVRLVVGRAQREGLPLPTLKYLEELHETAAGMGGGVRIADPPFHSKIYSVADGGGEPSVWVGSSNLTGQGLETGVEATARLGGEDAREAHEEAERLWESATPLPEASVPEVERYPVGGGPAPAGGEPGVAYEAAAPETEAPPDLDLEASPFFCVDLAPGGRVPERSGPNWWNGGGRVRDPNECYVPLRSSNRDAAEEVFGAIDPDTPFRTVTHDGQRLKMQLEGTARDRDRHREVAKNISSRGEKKSFGQWLLRDVLGLAPRELLTKAKLDEYGRTQLCFYRTGVDPASGEPIVYMDFSPPT